ncbi:MAG: 30S ribosomal protein S18 [Candidatus Fimivicinus sp.]|uniref:30S ribosomal protein S18 n=1 Tax=Candidatus Fimivicinus sp. TaxID=3056640 RepID=UPI001DDAC423|nr:30S ribosomal protein S18 [Clostridiales bacterium]MCI6400396.1 30S ribosomal protein S18 [Oscillospiraceae bacterium]MDY5591943.1 30S ribosomal protein S18 [Candidatus Fimivicinus sp.]
MAYDRNDRRGGRKGRRKVCSFCVDKIETIDYKDVPRLRKFISDRSKILPRRVTGTCAAHQRELTTAIKRARHVALLPYTSD